MNVLLFIALLAVIERANARSAIAIFNNAGVSGSVRFEQESAEDPVVVDVSFIGLEGRAGGYHVHEIPVNFGGSGFQFNSFDDLGCGFDITADHFNPLLVVGGANNKEAGPYLCSPEAQELCEAGDISGKFGLLTGEDTFAGSFVDGLSGLTLFGENSILGHSMVVHRPDGSRLLCANIFDEGANYVTTIATFDRESSGVEGTVTVLSDTVGLTQTVFVNLELGSSFPEDSATLDWGVHGLAVLDILNDNKFERCDEESVGSRVLDLTAALEPLTLVKGKRTKILRTLTTPFLDIGSSSLLLSSSGEVVDCSEFGKSAYVIFEADEQNGISGFFLFRQAHVEAPVIVSLELEGLDARADGYHVHTLPVFEDCASTSGHFNPLEIAGGDGPPGVFPGKFPGEYLCDKFNPELCESGDLSNRFGSLRGRDTASFTFSDIGAGLNLFGVNGIVGRSVVIHRPDGSRIACANIFELGDVLGAFSEYTTDINSVVGKISMVQRAVDPDAETSFVFDAARVDGESTPRHMFHIHEATVSESNDCGETLDHFSPNGVNGGAGQRDKQGDYLCDLGFEFCEIGDISGKHILADLPTRMVFTDFTVPLSGIFDVRDLAITIHDVDKTGPRIDCSNLVSFSIDRPSLTVEAEANEESDADESSNTALIVFVVLFAVVAAGLSVYVAVLKLNNFKEEEADEGEAEAYSRQELVGQATL